VPLTQDLVSSGVVFISSDFATVAERHVFACIGTKVKDDLPPFRVRDVQVVGLNRIEQHASIRSKDSEGNLLANGVTRLEVKLVGSADSRIEETQTIFARFNIVKWLRIVGNEQDRGMVWLQKHLPTELH
jgi:hypothetical protein